MKYGGYAHSCQIFNEGEVEDYTIDVMPSSSNSRSETPSNELISEEDDTVMQVTAYPNPATDILTVDYQLPTSDAVTISVFDITGKAVLLREIDADTPSRKAVLDVQELASGAYMLQIISGEHTGTIRFIKQ